MKNPHDLISTLDWKKVDNMMPAIVQDANTGMVLMQGYMTPEALSHTLECKQVTFFSRSKQRLWTKGESSGNVLKLVAISTDCDNDALLISAKPQGPTCHLGTPSCFAAHPLPEQSFLHHLQSVLSTRKSADPEQSYTASLFAKGTKRICQKVGEEGVEVALAAMANDRHELINESADLLYHLLVLLEDRDVPLSDVIDCLRQRHQ